MKKQLLGFWSIWNMSFGFLGIQFGFALQGALCLGFFRHLVLINQIFLCCGLQRHDRTCCSADYWLYE